MSAAGSATSAAESAGFAGSAATSAAGPITALAAATVVLGDRCVLGPLSLSIEAGQHWALLGPNGSGKTTLLSLVGAQRQPTSGSVTVLGERLGRTDLRRLRRRIGAAGHTISDRLPVAASALQIVLTGKDGLLAPWWGSFSPADEEAAGRLLDRLGCGELAGRRFGSCSQGERQRVLLARSLFGGHRLLLLDEPAVGVDLPGREALIEAMDALAAEAEPPTTVHVAHTLEELARSTTHALLLRDGRAVACGVAAEVLTSESLSECFGACFELERRADGRYAAWAVPRW